MKDIPISEAEKFCNDYQKDQVIILAWDRNSGDTWVTTYGKSDEDSAMAAQGANMVKDFLDLKREKDEIPKRFQSWKIESVDRYYYVGTRNSKDYVEITYWFDEITLERKETKREFRVYGRDTHNLPDWATACNEYRRQFDYDR